MSSAPSLFAKFGLTLHSVNSIFNPEYVDWLYPRSRASRQSLLSDARSTNYGVVRLELIEKLYERMYEQRRKLGSDERAWPHRILGGYSVDGADEIGGGRLQLRVRPALTGLDDLEDCSSLARQDGSDLVQVLDVDLIVAATGYKRNAHVDMLKGLWHLLPEVPQQLSSTVSQSDRWEVRPDDTDSSTSRLLEVARDYRVQFSPGGVASGSGVFLQGCCEGTHGVSILHQAAFHPPQIGTWTNRVCQPT